MRHSVKSENHALWIQKRQNFLLDKMFWRLSVLILLKEIISKRRDYIFIAGLVCAIDEMLSEELLFKLVNVP